MAEIPLAGGRVALVDDADLPLLSSVRNWSTVRSGKTKVYASGWSLIEHRRVLMHRLIMCADRGFMVDHINHNGLDNRRANLRVCTNAENRRNSVGRPRVRLARFKGIRLMRGKWAANIKVSGKSIHIGTYSTDAEAAQAYDAAARLAFGDFAFLNFK